MGTRTELPGELYGAFAPPERLALLLEALARDDSAEAARVKGTCPRKAYTMNDPAFADRADLAFGLSGVACADLLHLRGRLQALEWAAEAVGGHCAEQRAGTAMAFLDGARCGLGMPQSAFFGGPPLQPGGADAGESAGRGPPGPGPEPESEFALRMEAAERWSGRAGDELLLMITAAMRAVARDLAEVWAAFGAFCRTRLGVGPEAALRAWGLPAEADLREALERHSGLEPRPGKVKEYLGHLCSAWDGQFGGGSRKEAGYGY